MAVTVAGKTSRLPRLKWQRGSILVVVLWMVTIMSMLAAGLIVLSSGQIYFTRNYRNRVAQYYFAKAGIVMGYAELERDKVRSPSYDALKDDWSNKPEIFSNRTMGQGYFEVTYEYTSGQKVYNTMEGEQMISSTFYGMIDEERRININTINNVQILRDLFQQVANLQQDQARALADCIMDWRDADIIQREYGAENEYYQSLPNAYDCKNAKFEKLEELMLVKGMRPEYLLVIQDYITIFSSGKVNINTAPYQVLAALGLPGSLADKIIRCRAGTDEVEGTEDDTVFTNPGSIASMLTSREPLNSDESRKLSQLVSSNMLAVVSENFRIISTGHLNVSAGLAQKSTKITCIINRNGKIRYWQE